MNRGVCNCFFGAHIDAEGFAYCRPEGIGLASLVFYVPNLVLPPCRDPYLGFLFRCYSDPNNGNTGATGLLLKSHSRIFRLGTMSFENRRKSSLSAESPPQRRDVVHGAARERTLKFVF